jgi:2-C-methyl-D-erythritol 2,4-cyclodiphosphate synthase
MGVRFSADVRRLIVGAAGFAEKRGLPRPRVIDLADAVADAGLPLPSIEPKVLNDDLETVLGAAAAIAAGEEVTSAMLLKAMSELGLDIAPPPAGGAGPALPPAGTPPRLNAVPRVGIGYDSHRFAPGGPLVLGGTRIDADFHCAGHSDGDAICHALTDAVLGAASAGDIGEMFPDTDAGNKGRNSVEMLRLAADRVRSMGWMVANADVAVVAERPRLGPHRDAMREALAGPLGVARESISLKGKSNEGMGWIGRGEGLAVIAVVTLKPAIE